MNNKILSVLALFIIWTVLTPRSALSQMRMMAKFADDVSTPSSEVHEANLEEALTEILKSQQIESVVDVDCAKVSESQFAKLGDAWMETVHPGKSHEYMDRMMGGEGSETLQNAHIHMGRRYLGCLESWQGRGWHSSMMGMMGGWGGYGGGMTGFWSFWLVTWVLVNVLLVVLIRYFWKKGSDGKEK